MVLWGVGCSADKVFRVLDLGYDLGVLANVSDGETPRLPIYFVARHEHMC